MSRSQERTAVLVIRAWREERAGGPRLLARLLLTTDARRPGHEQRVAAGEQAILDAVAAWLRALAER